MRVSLFVTCFNDTLFPQTGRAVVRLLEVSLIRVGKEEYARQNESFGLTTMRDKHVDIRGSTLRFRFRGKSGKSHDVDIRDERLARIVKQCQDLPGQELFQYLDEEGQPAGINSEDVNDYIRETSGEEFTAKDFRTWNGSREAILELLAAGPAESATDAKRKLAACRAVVWFSLP